MDTNSITTATQAAQTGFEITPQLVTTLLALPAVLLLVITSTLAGAQRKESTAPRRPTDTRYTVAALSWLILLLSADFLIDLGDEYWFTLTETRLPVILSFIAALLLCVNVMHCLLYREYQKLLAAHSAPVPPPPSPEANPILATFLAEQTPLQPASPQTPPAEPETSLPDAATAPSAHNPQNP